MTSDRSQLALAAELEGAGAVTPTSLTLSDPNMPYDQWEALCRMIGGVRSSSCWWIGDLMLFGEGAYGDRASQAADEFGLAYDTVIGYAYVSRNVARRRRRATLTFYHHKQVAPLEPAEQSKWLDRAREGGWTARELHENMKAIEPGGDGSGGDGFAPMSVRDAARSVWLSSQRNGDNFLVPVEPMMVLASSLGVETA